MPRRSPLFTKYGLINRHAALVGTAGMALTLFPLPVVPSGTTLRSPFFTRYGSIYRHAAFVGTAGTVLTLFATTVGPKPFNQTNWSNPGGRW